MNDFARFAKEKLEIIHLDMIVYAKRWHPLKEAPSHKELREKVKSMIDNYRDKPTTYQLPSAPTFEVFVIGGGGFGKKDD